MGMLAISRKCYEEIFIGPDIRIVITDADRGRARVAISAPREVEILRREIAPAGHPLLATLEFGPRRRGTE